MSGTAAERPREDWRPFLEQVTKAHGGDPVTIEIFGRDFGDEYQAERVPLESIEYDDKDDHVIVVVGGRDGRYPVALRHMILHPQRVLADPPEPEAVRAIEIIDREDLRSIVSLFPAE